MSVTVHVWTNAFATTVEQKREFSHIERMTKVFGTTHEAHEYGSRVLAYAPPSAKTYVSALTDATVPGGVVRLVANDLDNACEAVWHDITDCPMLTCDTCGNDHGYKQVLMGDCTYDMYF